MKPYQQILIRDYGEPLVPILCDSFSVERPHPYAKLGAPYGTKSPYFLREGVLAQLVAAQAALNQQQPGWKIHIFDAYRPIAVQQFMVDYTFHESVKARGLTVEQLTDAQRQTILEDVYQFWAVPSSDPKTPPPHSTGAALDVTLVDADGAEIDMGSPIDEMSARSYPDHFADPMTWTDLEFPEAGTLWHERRCLLKTIMLTAGFRQHPREWWHFSLGDQLWAWLLAQEQPGTVITARYGAC